MSLAALGLANVPMFRPRPAKIRGDLTRPMTFLLSTSGVCSSVDSSTITAASAS